VTTPPLHMHVLAWFVSLSFPYQLMCLSSSSSSSYTCRHAEVMHTSIPGSWIHHTHDLVVQGGPSTDLAHHTPPTCHSWRFCTCNLLRDVRNQFFCLSCWTLSRQHGL
jgi:hypothetical protein